LAVILVIEDPYITKVGLIQLLKDNYYDVIAVNGAEAAMAALKKHSPLAIITDINLPDRNGLDFIEKTIKDSQNQETQFFIYTNEIDIKTEAALKQLKIFNFFSKNRDVRFLIRGVEQYYREALQKKQQQMLGDEYGNKEATVDTLVAFHEFHKGLEQQLTREDSDTHYELGISYMDMGLINSALREFQIAARSPQLFQGAYYMIAKCFLQKDMPKEAVESLRMGLSRDNNSEVAVGLYYEMAIILITLGGKKEALGYLRQVEEKGGNFRDSGKLIKELEKELAKNQPDQR